MLLKKDRLSFYDLLTTQAQHALEGAKLLCEYCSDPEEALGNRIKEIEREGDHARSNLVAEIHRSFVTPIDREDLFRLSGTIDDVMDYIWYTVKDLRIYQIDPDQAIADMAQLLLQMVKYLLESVKCLEKDRACCQANAIQVKKLENQINALFHKAMNALFEQDDIKQILRYREVYAHINHASDKGDRAADILMDILVKN